MFKVVRKSEAIFRVIAENKKSLNFITKDISEGVSLAITEGVNYSEQENAKYNRIYFVLKGELTLTFDNEKALLREEDSCFISQGTKYTMSGTFRAIVVNQPAFGI